MIPGKPVTITRLNSGQYHILWHQREQEGKDNVPVGFTGGAAQAIIFLSRIIFEDEANESLQKQREESKKIGDRILAEMKQNPSKFVETQKR